MPYPNILHHGAKDGVTGSCHQLLVDAEHSLLIDCGLFQGAETSWDNEALQRVKQGRKPLGFQQLLTVDSHQAHLAMVRHLAESARPAVVIAVNGMCSAGRIVNYLAATRPTRTKKACLASSPVCATGPVRCGLSTAKPAPSTNWELLSNLVFKLNQAAA